MHMGICMCVYIPVEVVCLMQHESGSVGSNSSPNPTFEFAILYKYIIKCANIYLRICILADVYGLMCIRIQMYSIVYQIEGCVRDKKRYRGLCVDFDIYYYTCTYGYLYIYIYMRLYNSVWLTLRACMQVGRHI